MAKSQTTTKENCMQITKQEKEQVRKLFMEKKKLSEIAKYLNDNGVSTKRGKSWTSATVSAFCRRELGFRRKKPYTKKASVRLAKSKAKVAPKVSTEVRVKPNVKKDLIMDILTSNIDRTNKITLLEKLL